MDNHATTPVDPRVAKVMAHYLTENFGNPASRNHAFGWQAEEAVGIARSQISQLIGAAPREIVFTSGATESNNLAIKGVAETYLKGGKHIITCVTEHRAVLDTCRRLEKKGYRVSYVRVSSDGLVEPEMIRSVLTDETILISIMYANNEIGVVQPIADIGQIARDNGIIFHVDAAQAVGRILVDVERDRIDLMSFTAHKIYGPKGIGALYVRGKPPLRLSPQMDGGGHERGMRSGTLNVPGIVGFGKACELCRSEMEEEATRLGLLRDRLREGIASRIEDVSVNGNSKLRLPHNLNISFSHVDGESLLMGLSDIAVSSGSACTTDIPEPSHVLRALGVKNELAHSSIRFGLGRFNTEAEVDYAIDRVTEVVSRLRGLSLNGPPVRNS